MSNQYNRRQFLSSVSLLPAVGLISPLKNNVPNWLYTDYDRDVTKEEEFWNQIRMAYTVSPNIINLNNGGVSPQPKIVQEAQERYNRYSNEAPTYYMWRILDQGREPVRKKLAFLGGCSPEEVAIDRNSSEALETIIFGLRLRSGDEVVLTKQDYPSMINAWKQREHRDGIILKWISFEFPIEDEQQMVDAFTEVFSSRTRLVHITHMINWNGQILPAGKIAQAAQERGIEVLVDAAHTFAQLPYQIYDLNCDYFGTSLHKWLCAPFGTGMLYVKKDKIKDIYPLLAAPDSESEDIRKFEHLGTRSFAVEQAIGQAVDFHNLIGTERKFHRLHYLKNYWANELLKIDRVRIHTSLNRKFSGALGLFSIDGQDAASVAQRLFNEFKIHTVAIDWENINGVRVTPNVYTLTSDLDRFVEGVFQITRS